MPSSPDPSSATNRAARREADRAKRHAEALGIRPPAFGPVSVVETTLGVGRSTAYELLNSGAIKAVRVGRSVRVDLASLDAYVASLRGEQVA